MNLFVLIFLLSYSQAVFSGEIYFQGPCSEKPFLRVEIKPKNQVRSVGFFSIDLLSTSKIEYIGSLAGISSIKGTPIGADAIEKVSDSELRAYGWCYEVNGIQPAIMPDQIKFTKNDIVRWFFAYSTYKNGVWIDYCTPSYELKSKFICK